jgi:two-component system response regulator YesN
MLKMIIADDEFIVRDGLRNIVSWDMFGIEIIAEAVDGQEALELCEQFHPDILLTDIRMPFIDGLEVAM